MKLAIYGEENDVIRLRLVRNYGDGIVLVAVDGSGDEMFAGRIVTIRESGVLCRNASINPKIGLPLDDRGRIILGGDT